MKETSFTSDCDYLAVVLKYEWIDDENEIESESYCIYVPAKPQDTISRIIETSSLI